MASETLKSLTIHDIDEKLYLRFRDRAKRLRLKNPEAVTAAFKLWLAQPEPKK